MTQNKPKINTVRFMIIDGNAIVHRSFHALPPLALKDGTLVNAVYGFLTTFFKAIKDLKPTHIAVTFDLAGPTFRHEEYKDYKATRVKQPDELYAQIPFIKEILQVAGIKIFTASGFEADDVIGTLVKMAEAELTSKHTRLPDTAAEIFIVTGDLDTLQLVDDTTRVYTMRKGLSDTIIYDEAAVVQRFSLWPNQLIDYKALRGDNSDNIGGVKGIGEKTATELIKNFDSLEKIYTALETAEKNSAVAAGVTARVQKMLLEQKEQALQSKRLVTIVRDVPIKFNLAECVFVGIDRGAVFSVFQKYEFLSLLARLPGSEGKSDGNDASKSGNSFKNKTKLTSTKLISDVSDTRQLVEKIIKTDRVAIYFSQPVQVDLFGATTPLIGFVWGKERAAVEIRDEAQWDEIGRFFTNKKVVKIGYDLKRLIHKLAPRGIALAGEFFDVMVAAYVLQAGTRAHDLTNLSVSVLNEDALATNWQQYDAGGAVAGADLIWRLAEKLNAELQEKRLWRVFSEIEMPLLASLARMERWGVALDSDYLTKLNKNFTRDLDKISERIYDLAGGKFNINSPQQVAQTLFAKLKISTTGIKRGKTGISTAAGELEKLQGRHKIVDLILEQRELAKLLNTYVEALPKLATDDRRVHTSFNQAVTATGRLSSSEPNLQNIPIRTEIGKKIRRAFVAAPGFTLLSCDYSQIELRIVAHLSGDKKMVEIFQKNLDVHRATAAAIHSVPIEKVTKEQRFSAKEVNFGIMYGMGAWGLATRTGLSRDEARDFIDRYFTTFSRLAEYLEETKALARKLGYVETLFGRRRYVPEIRSGVAAVRAAAERMAVNMPIQGTQADIIKKAMIAIDEFLCREYSCGFLLTAAERAQPARMLLQVHDELIFEVEEKLAKKIVEPIVDIMSSVVKLNVPIKTDFVLGKNWGELE